MKFFHDLRISTRLIIGFGIMLLLMVVLGGAALHSVGQLNQASLEVNSRMQSSALIQNIRDNITQIGAATDLAGATSERAAREQVLAGRLERVGKLKEWVSKYRDYVETPHEAKQYATLTQRVDSWLAAEDDALQLVSQGKLDDAFAKMFDSVSTAADALDPAIESLIAFNAKENKLAADRATDAGVQARYLVGISLGCALLVAVALARLLTRSILKPINASIVVAKRIAGGDLTGNVNGGSERNEPAQLLLALQQMQEALRAHTSQLEARVDERTKALRLAQQETTAALAGTAVLLNNSGQGFLAFNDDLRVRPDYSHECERIFGRPIAGAALHVLLFPDDAAQQAYIEKNFQRVFACGSDELRRSIYLELLPTEYEWGGRYYGAEYKYLGAGRMMLILTDISDEKALQEKVRQERQRLEFIVNAMENRNDLLDTLDAWQQFQTLALPALLDEADAAAAAGKAAHEMASSAALAEIYRQIHTYKGLFAQDGLPSIPRRLHELESRLAALRDGADGFVAEDIRRVLAQVDLAQPLASDLVLLRETLGEDYFAEGKTVSVAVERIDQLEARATALLPLSEQKTQVLLDAIRRLRYRSLHDLLVPHFSPAELLAARLDRKIEPIRYEGDDVPVDPRILGPFCKSLVHVFRNCIDHGIEDADSRLAAGKHESGRIHCRIERSGARLHLSISDDGRGIDPEQIRVKAVERGLITAETATRLSEAEVLRLIFTDRLSTREQVTEVSGRGIGLGACLRELEHVGGTVEVVSTPGAGSAFCFSLPLAEHVF
jgi:signal transduction histidine kinase/CHASE3 domain sensor protein